MKYVGLGPDYSGVGSGEERGPIATVTLNIRDARLLRRALSDWVNNHWTLNADDGFVLGAPSRALIEECARGYALGDDLDEIVAKFACPDEQARVVGYRQRVADIQAQADEDELDAITAAL